MSNNIIEALERDLQGVIYRHGHITGAEFQAAALRMAQGYYSENDLDIYSMPDDLAQALARELESLALTD